MLPQAPIVVVRHHCFAYIFYFSGSYHNLVAQIISFTWNNAIILNISGNNRNPIKRPLIAFSNLSAFHQKIIHDIKTS
jgi:hypothetical protein